MGWRPLTSTTADKIVRNRTAYGRGSNETAPHMCCGVPARTRWNENGDPVWTCRKCDRVLATRKRRPWASKVRSRTP